MSSYISFRERYIHGGLFSPPEGVYELHQKCMAARSAGESTNVVHELVEAHLKALREQDELIMSLMIGRTYAHANARQMVYVGAAHATPAC